jgi:hypothetical protein
MEHTCAVNDSCCCGTHALEPHARCPIHSGYGSWPPRCADCGKFLKKEASPLWRAMNTPNIPHGEA